MASTSVNVSLKSKVGGSFGPRSAVSRLACSRLATPRGNRKALRAPKKVQAVLKDRADSPTVKIEEPKTGISFPLVIELGIPPVQQRCIGVGNVQKNWFGPISFNQMALGMYVNADLAARELGIRSRGGFELDEGSLGDVILDGAFTKSLVFETCCDMNGPDFAEKLHDELEEKLKFIGSYKELRAFAAMFDNLEMKKGTEVALVWEITGDLQVVIREPDSQTLLEDLAKGNSVRQIHSNALCRGIFELYLGERQLAKSLKSSVAEGATKLLESDTVRREYNKRSIWTEKSD